MAFYIGLMSGTSLDGIDCALVDFVGDEFKIVSTQCTPFPDPIRQHLLQLTKEHKASFIELGELNVALGECYANACLDILKISKIKPAEVIAVGCHGQTIFHSPKGQKPFTWQLGDPHILNVKTTMTTVSDFRSMDVALGGQGAPLAPGFHAVFFSNQKENRAIVNIGGIANVTLLQDKHQVIGFDTGPGNGLMDLWVEQYFGMSYDKNGELASEYSYDKLLLDAMLQDLFFHQTPPKSTGREHFNLDWVQQHLDNTHTSASRGVVLSTLCELTAISIAHGIHFGQFCPMGVYICGGGAHNLELMQRLKKLNPTLKLASTAAIGLDPDWVEAVTFAWLAKCFIDKKPGNLPSVTGASKEVVLGSVCTHSI